MKYGAHIGLWAPLMAEVVATVTIEDMIGIARTPPRSLGKPRASHRKKVAVFRKTLFVVLAIGFVTSLVLQAQGGIEIKKGEVYVSGENPGIRLLMKEGADPSTEVSFWRVIYSPAGIGHVCYVTSDITGDGPSSDDVRVALTDNDALADYLSKDIMSVFNKVYVENPFPKSRATFQKSGDTRKEWKETIKSDKYTVELLWRDFYTPFLIDVPVGGQFLYGITSMFIPARSADVVINGRKAAGTPFPEPMGAMQSSSAFLAFSETWVK